MATKTAKKRETSKYTHNRAKRQNRPLKIWPGALIPLGKIKAMKPKRIQRPRPTKKPTSQNVRTSVTTLPYGIRPVVRTTQSQVFVTARPAWIQYFIDVFALAAILALLLKVFGV